MSVLNRKYPFPTGGNWLRDCLLYCAIVVLILFFLQPFGFHSVGGNKFLLSLVFGAVTFCGSAIFYLFVFGPLQRKARVWKVWHQILTVLGMVVFIGLCNFVTFALIFHIPFLWEYCLQFLYWTLIIGTVITIITTSLSYHRFLRKQLDVLLTKTTQQQEGVVITIHDTRVRGNDLRLPINDLLYIEAQKNNVAVCYREGGKFVRKELQSTLVSVLADLSAYENVFQCHRSFAVNLNNITYAQGNSNGYTLEFGEGVATVPVSRSYVPKLRSFID